MATPKTFALVGAVGGAGTTRLAVEFAASLAHDGRDVAVLDAAYATQGLAQYVGGRIDPDVTRLCLDDDPLADGLVDLQADLPGRVALCPAFAPFERVARAKTPAAAQRFEERVEEAAGWFDHVLVDTPPIAANQAVAAANVADRVALVSPPTRRGLDGLPRATGRLADVGVGAHSIVLNRIPGSTGSTGSTGSGVDPGESGTSRPGEESRPVAQPDAVVPESRVSSPADAPAVVDEGSFAEGVAGALELVLGVELDVPGGETGVARYLPG